MLRKFLVSLPLMIVAVGGGVAVASYLIATKPPPVVKPTEVRPTRVEVYRVSPRRVEETFAGYGTARPDEVTTLSAQVAGKIVEVARGLEDGSVIEAGRLLLRIEEADYKYQLERAANLIKADQATLKQIDLEGKNLEKLINSAQQDVRIAQDERLRVSRLFERKLAARREFDLIRSALLRATGELDNLQTRLAVLDPRREQIRASMAAHQAEVALARLSLERCRIIAPFDGRMKQRLVEVGETVAPGMPLLIALKLDRIEVPIELSATCAAKVRVGNACSLFVESVPDLRWLGKLERISPSADVRSRTITAYVVVDNTKQSKPLLPGLFVRAEVAGPVYENALVLPRGAIREGFVFVAAGKTAHRRKVELACSLKDEAVVIGGIREGDAVILTNLAGLEDDMPVEVVTSRRRQAKDRRVSAPSTQAADGR